MEQPLNSTPIIPDLAEPAELAELSKIAKIIRKNEKGYRRYPDATLLAKVEANEFSSYLGASFELDWKFRKLKLIMGIHDPLNPPTIDPKVLETWNALISIVPELSMGSIYYTGYILNLRELASKATKNTEGLQGLLAFKIDDHETFSHFDILRKNQRCGFPWYMAMQDKEFAVITKIQIPRDSGGSYLSLSQNLAHQMELPKLIVDASAPNIKRSMIKSMLLKIFRPSPAQREQVAAFFGCTWQTEADRNIDDQNQVLHDLESLIIQNFCLLPARYRMIYAAAHGINMRRTSQCVIGECLNVTESRICQLLDQTQRFLNNCLTLDQLRLLSDAILRPNFCNKMPLLSGMFDTKKNLFRFLCTLAQDPQFNELKASSFHKNHLYDALAQHGTEMPLDEFWRFMEDSYGIKPKNFTYSYINSDLIDDPDIQFTDEVFTVKSMPLRYLVGAISVNYTDGIHAPQLLKAVEASPQYKDDSNVPIIETFRKCSYLFTLDKGYYKHIHYYDPNERELQIVIKEMMAAIKTERPETIKSIHDLHTHLTRAKLISPFYFYYVFRKSCESVDFDIHPSYFELMKKPTENLTDEAILKRIKSKRGGISRSEFAGELPFDLRYTTMRLSQLVRAKKLIRISREHYDIRERALKGLNLSELHKFIENYVSQCSRIVDFSHLTDVANNHFALHYEKEFYHSIFVHEMEQGTLNLSRYLVSKNEIPYASLRDLVNRRFNPEDSDQNNLERLMEVVLISDEMASTILRVWYYALRRKHKLKIQLKAG